TNDTVGHVHESHSQPVSRPRIFQVFLGAEVPRCCQCDAGGLNICQQRGQLTGAASVPRVMFVIILLVQPRSIVVCAAVVARRRRLFIRLGVQGESNAIWSPGCARLSLWRWPSESGMVGSCRTRS